MTERVASAAQASSASSRRLPRADSWMIVAGLALLALLVVALFGGRFAPHEPVFFVVEHGNDPRPYDPGVVFPLGSDVLGRDIFSLVLAGARATLTIVLLGGLARVAAGVLVAVVGTWWRPVRLATESVAELVSAIPATIVALVLVKVLVRSDTSVALFIGALLLLGWAGPYRVIRAELDRLASAPFTEGAEAIGVRRWQLFSRHYLPHLFPVIAMNASQQVVASLVLVAELGALGVFVGATRVINIEESLRVVRTGPLNAAQISDPPEWGGLLANARTLESLWTTRWLILVPGVAFAVTAVAVAAIGFALARRYARRDFTDDLRSPWAAAVLIAALGCFALSSVLPERYARASEWADAARADLKPANSAAAFAAAGLRPIGSSYAVTGESTMITQTAPANVTAGAVTLAEPWPRDTGALFEPDVRSLVTADTGGGVAQAPLVFAGRGISGTDFPLRPANPFAAPDISRLVQDYADDYAAVDVRGKVVLLVRFLGVASPTRNSFLNGYSFGPSVDESIGHAISRGAAGVIFVDPALTYYTNAGGGATYGSGEVRGGVSPYGRLERDAPATSTTTGVPVVIVSPKGVAPLLASVGLDLSAYDQFDTRNAAEYRRSPARDLGVTARMAVPLARQSATATSYVAEVGGLTSDTSRVLVWAERPPGQTLPASDVLAALGGMLSARHAPFIFVDFDPSGDPQADRKLIARQLGARRISLVLVLTKLEGTQLRLATPYGDLIPAMDLYADRAGARHELTRSTPPVTVLSDSAPLVGVKTVLIGGNGGDGDLRPDATALIGYLAGRLALGAEELPR